ncbi:MAG TPA: SGNH/GDSL hydrolase family protein [Candidatus Udaeobacter sp.]|nr:SGNH/GDSL hydrolase family protein [Candidatus Udaeobacter sp.]
MSKVPASRLKRVRETWLGKMKSAPFVSRNFLERVTEPGSPFHLDYLAYRRGEIGRAELIARLPHVAMLGDSVCMGIYISSAWNTLWRARRSGGKNWFLHIDDAPNICSISKSLETITPFVAIECAGVGALVDEEHRHQNLFRRILGTRNFSAQVGELVEARRFPDLILISIGHNSVDWAWRCPPHELEEPEERLKRLSNEFRQNYVRELRRLLEVARIQQHHVAIVVYGLINFESYFKGREAAEHLRKSDRTLYPHLETTYRYFISFRPAYRRNLIRLAAMLNEELRSMVEDLNREFVQRDEHIQLRYSDALATADLSRAELLHPTDGWHASVEGHSILGEAAFNDLRASLDFLKIR